jgi:hypothetical protein
MFISMRTSLIALVALVGSASAVAQVATPLPETPGALEYKSVAEALEAAKARPGASVSVTKPDGWVIVNEGGGQVVWSFTPEGHYAHPAVVRRMLVVRDGQVTMEMRALCEAQKEPCDRLIREFEELNQRMREAVQQRLKERK